MATPIREDLLDAHHAAWVSLTTPVSWWTGEQRLALAQCAVAAINDPAPVPPWVPVTSTDRFDGTDVVSAAALDVTYRIARHAGTMTADGAQAAMDELGALAYVELCGVDKTVPAVVTFARNAGVDVPPLPDPIDGAPTGQRPTTVVDATLNWVPVAAPADERPAVVQAYTGVPIADEITWQLAAAQYIPGPEMGQPDWMRRPGGLTRPEAELIAARIAQLRECFY